MWFALSVLSALSKSASQILTKRLHGIDTLELAAFSHIFSALIIFPLAIFIEFPTAWAFWTPTIISSFLNVIAILLLIKAIKISDLSYSIPFLSLTPIFAIGVAYLFRGEEISVFSASGIFLVVIGALTIDARSLNDALSLGGRRVFKDFGVQLVILVALIYAISSVCDKSATLASTPLTYVWLFTFTRAIIFGVLLLWKRQRKFSQQTLNSNQSAYLPLAILGAIYFCEAIFQMLAFNYGNVAETIGVKRLSILFTSLSGFALFKEQVTANKIFGAICLATGSIVIYLFR